MKNIYLIGFMGTGKTTVGRKLADMLGKKFVEMDDIIEEKEGLKVADIFETKGEPHFRHVEKEVLIDLCGGDNLVVSCGGGVAADLDNIAILKKTGVVFWLTADEDIIYERVKKYTTRPLLNVENPKEKIKELLQQRRSFYEQAHYQIDSTPPAEEIALTIVSIIMRDFSEKNE